MIRNNNPTLEDVARTANVSTATISRSINEPHKVAGITRERIQQVILELVFTPNFGGKVLATKRSNTVWGNYSHYGQLDVCQWFTSLLGSLLINRHYNAGS